MNEIPRDIVDRRRTQAAEGLDRWRWTVPEVERMAEAGFFGDGDRLELIGGELVPMSPKGRRHEIVRGDISLHLARSTPPEVHVGFEAQLTLGDDTYLTPDILLHHRSIKTPDVRGGDVLLAIEVADTSLGFDLATKARIYANHGFREYWVVNAATLVTTVFTMPSADSYADRREVEPHERVEAAFAVGVGLTLGKLIV